MKVKNVVDQLLKDGSVLSERLIIKKVTPTSVRSYDGVYVTFNRKVKQYVRDANGNYVEGESRTVRVLVGSIAAVLREDARTTFAAGLIEANPILLVTLLEYAEVDVVLQDVPKGTEYTNPFSERDIKRRATEHDSIYTHIVRVTLSSIGMQELVSMRKEWNHEQLLIAMQNMRAKLEKSRMAYTVAGDSFTTTDDTDYAPIEAEDAEVGTEAEA